MSEIGEFDWEGSTAAAWRTFQARLADHLLEMEDDDLLLLEAEPGEEHEGATPYVQFCAWGDGQLRCEAVSNHYLAQPYRLHGAALAQLLELGFEAPSPDADDLTETANYWVDVEGTEADRLAVIAVRALREVYGVAHPAFLTGHPLDDADGPSESPVPSMGDEQLAVYPSEGFEQLQRLVDEALTPWLGHPPVHDNDGDVPIDCGEIMVFVRVLADRPVVRLFACVASDIDDLGRAASEVAILNRDQLFFKFLLLGDAIVVHADLPAWPFAGAHLRDLAAQMCNSVGQIHADLAVRLVAGGDETDAEADEVVHPAMQTLLELDAGEPGSVDARLAAAICEHDRDLVLRLLTWSQENAEEWTTELLRAALRVVVERQAARYDRERSRRHSSSRSLPPRSGRRVPDPTLEEVDPEMWNR